MSSTIIEEVARVVRRESGRRQRVVATLAHLGFALDASAAAMSSTEELARHALKKLGVTAEAADPVSALDFYLIGLQQHRSTERTRSWAADANDSDSAMARFFEKL
jgi:cytochrome c biogenesis factor